MNKIICDICGTSYPDTAESCPICGCSRDSAADFLNADVLEEEVSAEMAVDVERKDVFAFAEENKAEEDIDRNEDDDEDDDDEDAEDSDDEDDDDEEDDDDTSRSNVFVVILLTVLIIVLLGAAAFIYFRFFLPNRAEETTPTTIVQELPETTAAATELTIPCEHLVMTNAGIAELNAEGQQFLLHIRTIPEDTTDKIIYTSGNESVATVSEDGKITAVAEGETIVYISCGTYSIECPVIVKYVEETVPPTTEIVEETTGEIIDETVSETAANEETTPAANKDVVLKLKKTDIQLGVYYQFQLVLDCDLNPEDVTWTSEHPHIAKVDEQGNVTAMKEGTTSVTAKYGDQEVKCMVRCVWY